MGTLNIYKGLNNEYKTFRTNGTIKDALKVFAPELNAEHCIILNGGSTVTLDYEIKEDDIVFIRETPNAAAAVVCAVISVICAGVALGMSIYSAVQNQKAQEEAEKAEKEAKALAETPESKPFLKGASNKNALGYNIPFVMGSMYLAPYKITGGYYQIGGYKGKEQYWSVSLCAGYKNCVINNLSVGSKKLVEYNTYVDVPKLDGTTERVYYIEPSKTLIKTGEKKAYFHSGTYTKDENQIQISNSSLEGISDPLTTLTNKISCTSYGDEIPHEYGDTTEYKEGLTKELEQNTYRADICVMFDGLRYYNDGWKALNEKFTIQWCNNLNETNPTWHTAGTLETGDTKENTTVRFEYNLIFSASECYNKDISVRIIRETEKKESNGVDTAYLCYINCWQYDAVKSSETNIVPCKPIEDPWNDRTIQIGIKLPSNDSTKDTLDEINCMVYGTARIWNGTEWTSIKYPTRNPASWILEIMTAGIHPHSKYSDSEIDLLSLGSLYEYCENENFYCDGIVSDDQKKSDLLNQILTECNATMFMDNTGLWTFAIEQKQETPIALLNEQSIKSITVSKSFERKAYAQKITLTDRTTWNMNTVYINENNEVNATEIYDKEKLISETTVKYITSIPQALKYARRQIAKAKLQPREITVNVGHEGDYYPLYSKVLLQMKQLKVGLSSGTIHSIKVTDNKITEIQTSDLCDFSDTSKTYGIIIQAQNDGGVNHLYAKVKGNGKTRTLTLVDPLSYTFRPEFGNIYSFGYLDDNGDFTKITNPMTIYGAKQNTTGWELTLKDYNDSLFEYGSIPEYKSNLTIKKEPSSKVPALTYSDVKSAVAEVKAEITDTIDVNKYTLDISPEAQSIPVDQSGNLSNSWFYISAYLYYMDNELTENVSYSAHLADGSEVGTWENNKVKISSLFLKGDILYITIKAVYKIDDENSITRTLDAQITRLYGADSTKVYKMLFNDGEKVKIDDTGEVVEPEQLRVTKRVTNGESENNTEYGKITVENYPQGAETDYNAYNQVESTETYSTSKTYYHKALPFLIKADDNSVIGDGDGNGALFFEEVSK